jgi:integrase
VPLTADELERLRASAPDWFRVALTLGAAVGLRHAETTGLTVDRIDFLHRTLTVDRQLVTLTGAPAFGPPKTKRSYRTIPLADVALENLARHIETFGAGSDGLVLHLDGRPVRRNRFGQIWRGTRRRAELPSVRFHDTRHTYAALLLSGGISVAAVADYMGHSPATLLSTYTHLIPADHDRARGVVQAAFSAPNASSDGTETGRAADAASV